ncbi:MAG: M12 family metallopeptidase [Phycisphaerales bacterium]|nr:M12 family metallopeptidase [Phycisphaerales bacterium]
MHTPIRSQMNPPLASLAVIALLPVAASPAFGLSEEHRPVESAHYPPHPLWPDVKAAPRVPCTANEFTLPVRNRGAWTPNLWPGGIVPYEFDPEVTQINRDRFRIAMDELQTVANLTFVPRTTETAYIYARNSGGNSSSIGRTGVRQNINLFNWDFRYTVIHEIMHALGCWHEQNRTDRDTYVTVNFANTSQACFINLAIWPDAGPVGPYDFESIMHYGPTDCSINGQPTIQATPAFAAFQSLMGNFSYMSQGDKDGLSSRYGLPIDDALEPNDTRPTAIRLAANTPTELKLLDEDFFLVPVNTTVNISATAPGIWALGNATMHLQSSTGIFLSSAPFTAGGPGATASISGSFGPGPFFVWVTRTQPWGGSYTLNLSVPCPVDFNGTGGLNVQDIFSFLNAWFAGNPTSDFDGLGGVTVQDIFSFLNAWFAGC